MAGNHFKMYKIHIITNQHNINVYKPQKAHILQKETNTELFSSPMNLTVAYRSNISCHRYLDCLQGWLSPTKSNIKMSTVQEFRGYSKEISTKHQQEKFNLPKSNCDDIFCYRYILTRIPNYCYLNK